MGYYIVDIVNRCRGTLYPVRLLSAWHHKLIILRWVSAVIDRLHIAISGLASDFRSDYANLHTNRSRAIGFHRCSFAYVHRKQQWIKCVVCCRALWSVVAETLHDPAIWHLHLSVYLSKFQWLCHVCTGCGKKPKKTLYNIIIILILSL